MLALLLVAMVALYVVSKICKDSVGLKLNIDEAILGSGASLVLIAYNKHRKEVKRLGGDIPVLSEVPNPLKVSSGTDPNWSRAKGETFHSPNNVERDHMESGTNKVVYFPPDSDAVEVALQLTSISSKDPGAFLEKEVISTFKLFKAVDGNEVIKLPKRLDFMFREDDDCALNSEFSIIIPDDIKGKDIDSYINLIENASNKGYHIEGMQLHKYEGSLEKLILSKEKLKLEDVGRIEEELGRIYSELIKLPAEEQCLDIKPANIGYYRGNEGEICLRLIDYEGRGDDANKEITKELGPGLSGSMPLNSKGTEVHDLTRFGEGGEQDPISHAEYLEEAWHRMKAGVKIACGKTLKAAAAAAES